MSRYSHTPEMLAASAEKAVSFSARIERVKRRQVSDLLAVVVVVTLYTLFALDEGWS